MNRVTSVHNALGQDTTVTYDPSGDVLTTTDARGMTPPIGSLTMPLILDVVSTCAIAGTNPVTPNNQAKSQHFKIS